MRPGDMVRCRWESMSCYMYDSSKFVSLDEPPRVIGHLSHDDVGIVIEEIDETRVCMVLLPNGRTGWVTPSQLEVVDENW